MKLSEFCAFIRGRVVVVKKILVKAQTTENPTLEEALAFQEQGTITIMLSRDKYAEDEIERNTTNISVPKNRSASKTGRNVAKVYYSPEHSTLFSYEYAQTNNFFKDVTPEGIKKHIR